MGRGNDTAQAASKNALGYSGTLQGQQGNIYSTLAPTLTRDIANPVGLNPTEKANANTAAQESIGGSQAAAVGQGALNAQRTRNAGSADAAVQESARQGGRQLSQAALGTEMADAELKQRKMAAAKGEMAGLYGTSTGGGNAALGQVASNVNANTNAEDASWNWAKYILDPTLQAGGTAGGGYLAGKCWIAEIIYGFDDPRTHLIRLWLNGPFASTNFGRIVHALYGRFGRWIAARRRLALTLKPLFEIALRKAKAT